MSPPISVTGLEKVLGPPIVCVLVVSTAFGAEIVTAPVAFERGLKMEPLVEIDATVDELGASDTHIVPVPSDVLTYTDPFDERNIDP